MYILVPTTITDAVVSSSTAVEPSATETAWNAATNYVAGDKAYLASTHRVYENIIAGVNATSPELTLQDTAPRWIDFSPTNKWAALDTIVNTQTAVVTPLTYVLRPGLFNAINLFGLDGADISISIKTAPAGSVFYTHSGSLTEPPFDYYDYYFGTIRPLTKLFLKDITPYADPELTITVTGGTGVVVKLGMIVIGDLRQLVRQGSFGGIKPGATAEPVTYSYIKTDEWGTTKIIRRGSGTGMTANVIAPIEDADYILEMIQAVLDVPCAVIATKQIGYAGLNVFGLIKQGPVTYDQVVATIALSVQGMS